MQVAQASACERGFRRLAWLAALLAVAAYADDVVPVGIILDAENSQIQVPGTETWFTAAPGWSCSPVIGSRLQQAPSGLHSVPTT
jgi:hypothetical protein